MFVEYYFFTDNWLSFIFRALGGALNSNRLAGRFGLICQSEYTASYCGFIGLFVYTITIFTGR